MLSFNPMHKVFTSIQNGSTSVLVSATNDDTPVAVMAEPGSGWVTELAGFNGVIREDDWIIVWFDPFSKVRVREVLRESKVLDLGVVGVNASVEHDWFVSREDGD